MVAWVVLNRHLLPPMLVSRWLRQLVIVFLINGFITFQFAEISKGAHIGGALVGLAVAVPMNFYAFSRGWRRVLAGALVAAVPAFCLALLAWSFRGEGKSDNPEEIRDINSKLKEVTRLELEAQTDYQPVLQYLEEKPPRSHQLDGVNRLHTAQEKLKEASQLLEKAGPYESHRPEKARQLYLNLLQKKLELYQTAETLLANETVWNPEDNAWKKQIEDIDRLRNRLNKVQKGNSE
jgi:hypothetical protein